MAISPSPSFGHWLKQRRRQLGLTQSALAQAVPCAEITIRKLEAGTIRPGKGVAERLAVCLELEPQAQAQFVLVARGLATPPFETAPSNTRTPRHNLLRPTTSLIGREQVLRKLQARLAHPTVQVLTISGTGGVGKTRLLQEFAFRVLDAFPDGVYWVDLAPLSDATWVLSTIAQVLGVYDNVGIPLHTALQEFLGSRRLLLLVDNFEHVLEAAHEIERLVSVAPSVKVVVTSRERLNLRAEHLFPLDPLDTPATVEADATTCAAMQLFVERAQAANPDFVLNRANRAAVLELVERLDGLPLALELAAARVRLLGARALLARLEHPFTVLSGHTRDRPARQQSLRATLDWSFQLLSPPEQRVFVRLGVFHGGATLEAAEAVCSQDRERYSPFLDIVAALVDKNLVKRSDTTAGEPRLMLLETVRAYALEQLSEEGTLSDTRNRHLAYFLALAEEGALGLRHHAQAEWLALLKAETENFRAALAGCMTPPLVETGLRLTGALHSFWEYTGLYAEGYHWIDQLLTVGGPASKGVTARAMMTAGYLMAWQHDITKGRQMLEASLQLATETGDLVAQGHARLWLPAVIPESSWEQDLAFSEETLLLFQQTNDAWGLAIAKWRVGFYLGLSTTSQPQAWQRAHRLLHESDQSLRQLGDFWHLSYTETGFGILDSAAQQYAAAYAHFEQAWHYARASGSLWVMDTILHNLAETAVVLDRPDLVYRHRQTQYEQSTHIVAVRRAIDILVLGVAERDLDHMERAVALYRESLEFARRHGMWQPPIDAIYELFTVIVYTAHFQDDGPPHRLAQLARAIFRTSRLLDTFEHKLWEYAATLLGALACLLQDERLGVDSLRNAWFGNALHVEAVLPYDTFQAALARGYAMTLEQAIAFALYENPDL